VGASSEHVKTGEFIGFALPFSLLFYVRLVRVSIWLVRVSPEHALCLIGEYSGVRHTGCSKWLFVLLLLRDLVFIC
jgi:hypothetical protein